MANTTYATVADVRAEGLTDAVAYPDALVQARLNLYAQYIERVTGQFFDVRALTLLLDGDDTDTLYLPFPIVALNQLFINGRFGTNDAMNLASYTVFNRQFPQDDRRNPKIKLNTVNLDFYQMAAFGSGGRGFMRGLQNQKLVGTFGYVEADGSTPLLIRRALLLLVCRWPDILAPGSVPREGNQKGIITSESTDGHSISYQTSRRLSPQSSITGDAEVDNILIMYKRPIRLAVTGASYYAGQSG